MADEEPAVVVADPNLKKMESLAMELEALRIKVRDQELSLSAGASKPLVISTGRQLPRFKDKPLRAGDTTLEEWISDMKVSAETRKLSEEDYAVLLCDNLGGRARQEILARGPDTRKSPWQIIKTLRKVFGEGNDLPAAQHRFYSYRQAAGSDLVTTSLDLIELYDKIVEIDSTFHGMKEMALKGQLAESAYHEVQRREIRRLTREHPELSFLDLRDRVIEWLGGNSKERSIVYAQEHQAQMADILKRQEAIIERQQEQIASLLNSSRPRGPRTCWSCGEEGHIQRRCPRNRRNPPKQALNQ
ncbi:uncharacterized protein LOC124282150 [Haliotis rubra]|uniref:uncharacterized protein LOC124282150 n=1 Tax=Haliotis rubra TaxID=36100 RepID=UPI001EE618F3|nr:uncharacterized protein LOC124282150 [Haliotis rubra]